MLLSILIPSVPSRRKIHLQRILDQIELQTNGRNDVEVLVFYDNKMRTVGKKRNALVQLANGKYLVFIDDDDRIADDYISQIIEALKCNPNTDCVVFDSITTIIHNKTNDSIIKGVKQLCKYGIEYEYNNASPPAIWTGKPAHTMVYKSEIAKKNLYLDINNGEDIDWVKRASTCIVKQTRIDKVLYYYDFNQMNSEAK